jgi:hypothetical protein
MNSAGYCIWKIPLRKFPLVLQLKEMFLGVSVSWTRGACASRQVLCGPALAKNSPLVHISGKPACSQSDCTPNRLPALSSCIHDASRSKRPRSRHDTISQPTAQRQKRHLGETCSPVPERVLQGYNLMGHLPMGLEIVPQSSILYKTRSRSSTCNGDGRRSCFSNLEYLCSSIGYKKSADKVWLYT